MIKLGDEGTSNDGRQPDSHYLCQALNNKDDSESHPIGSVASEISPPPQTELQKIGKHTGNGVKVDPKWQVLVIDDHSDSAFTIKSILESYSELKIETSEPEPRTEPHPIQVTTYVDPILALLEFKPYHYDLLIVDIDMPYISGYELVGKIVKLDFNIKVCFMSAGEVNDEALREIRHPSRSIGCFIKKPASRDDLVGRVLQELD